MNSRKSGGALFAGIRPGLAVEMSLSSRRSKIDIGAFPGCGEGKRGAK